MESTTKIKINVYSFWSSSDNAQTLAGGPTAGRRIILEQCAANHCTSIHVSPGFATTLAISSTAMCTVYTARAGDVKAVSRRCLAWWMECLLLNLGFYTSWQCMPMAAAHFYWSGHILHASYLMHRLDASVYRTLQISSLMKKICKPDCYFYYWDCRKHSANIGYSETLPSVTIGKHNILGESKTLPSISYKALGKVLTQFEFNQRKLKKSCLFQIWYVPITYYT